MAISRKILDTAEQELIGYYLSLSGQHTIVKSALQRLCFALENRFVLIQTQSFRQQVLGHLWSEDIFVRRWAIKAIALLGLGPSTRRSIISSRLPDESDFENRTWLIAAISKLFSEPSVKKICDDEGIDYEKEYDLSVRLFRDSSGLETIGTKFVNIEKEGPLALKWFSLLEGYQKAPENLAHTSFSNTEMVRQLNRHHDAIVSEYSVWSLWQNPNCSAKMLSFKEDEISTKAVSVRRWIYRLYAKTPNLFVQKQDLFSSFTNDVGVKAREGLALGLSHEVLAGIEDLMLEWYSCEEDPEVRDLVLEHIAKNSTLDSRFPAVVTKEYRKYLAGASFRKRMLSSASGTALLNDLRKIDLMEDASKLRDEMASEPSLFNNGSTTMTNINITGSVGNFSTGNLKIETEKFKQSFKSSSPDSAAALNAILDFLSEDSALSEEEKAAIKADTKAMVDSPDAKKAATLKGRLVSGMRSLGDGAKIAAEFRKMIELLDGWIG
jgi:hypothetical protein